MPLDRKLLGERIREVRKARGTQKLVAEELAISEGHLRELEAGRGGAPSSELLVRIAELGNRSVDWLLGHGAPAPMLDAELLGRIMQTIARIYREQGVTLSELDLCRLAADDHNRVVGAAPDSWPAILNLVEAHHRERLAKDHPARRTRRGA